MDVHEEFIPQFWLSLLSHYCEALSHQLNQLGFRDLSAAHLVYDGVHHWKIVILQAELCLSLALSCSLPPQLSSLWSSSRTGFVLRQPKRGDKPPRFRAALPDL